MQDNSVDSCISDFPYDLSFMGRKWDNIGDFYNWNMQRAEGLHRIIKPCGYVAIFGHPKTNHRMKCAFEDSGFRIVEEIDWIYLTGMPKNQDIGKLFDKAAGCKRPLSKVQRPIGGKNGVYQGQGGNWGETINTPQSDLAKKWDGWKTAGLKPAHETITIFQKPPEGTYIKNIEKYGCGGMNIDACRVPYKNKNDINTVKAKCNFTENAKSIGFGGKETIYGIGNTPLEQARECVKEEGRFPANIILDEYTAEILDEQTGGDGGSRMFTVIKYFPKVSPSERKLPSGERNPHVTLKPVDLIKWLTKLLTPIDGMTIDITAGSGTHGVACEELNRDEGYNLHWVNIELMNTESEPFCDVGKERLDAIS